MIIKKKYAQLPPVAAPVTPERSDAYDPMMAHQIASAPVIEQDPYAEALPEDFEGGRLPDRRRNDRRQGFRRVEDQELISQAHEEANAIREAAEQAGFEEGLARSQQIIDELNEAIQSFLSAREEALASAGDALASMAIEIAERIIRTEVSCDEELVMYLVRDTINKVGQEQKSMTIKVNPIDHKLVKETMKIDSQMPDNIQIIVSEDESVEPGSCMVESRAGLIDARFGTQLEILKHLILKGKG